MKAARLSYARAASVDEALALLAEGGDAARVIAGGQSLVPALNLRLMEGPLLVDIGRIETLRGIAFANGVLRLGALTRHAELERDTLVAAHAPMLAQAAPLIAHAAIRAKGTLGGSIAHADPASELPACLVALDATVEVIGVGGARRIAAADFFLGLFDTALAPGEIVSAVEIAAAQAGRRFAVRELARRSGDYAIAGLALAARPRGGVLADPRAVFFGVGDRPVRALSAEAALALGDIEAACDALDDDLDPPADLQGAPAFKRQLARTLLRRTAAEITEAAR